MNFRSGEYFTFKGYNSSMYSLKIIESEEDSKNFLFGASRNVVVENNVLNLVEDDEIEIPITIAKFKNANEITGFKDKELRDINRWLFEGEEYSPLIINVHVYYVIFTKGKRFTDRIDKGYITLTARLMKPCVFSNPIYDIKVVNLEKDLEIRNNSTANVKLYPKILIEILEPTTKIEILNITNRSSLVLEGLSGDIKEITIDNENRTIEEKNKKNLFPNLKQKWLDVKYGVNKINVKTDGRIKITLIYQMVNLLQ